MLFVVHNSAETKVGDEQFGILGLGAEEEVLRLEIAVYDPGFMNVFNGVQYRSYDICCVPVIQKQSIYMLCRARGG